MRHVTHGPAISRFELEMAAGIKVNKVTELDRNIAMNMEVKSVRIEAPIPGKSLVGVEVPNKTVTPVTLREVLELQEMKELSPLPWGWHWARILPACPSYAIWQYASPADCRRHRHVKSVCVERHDQLHSLPFFPNRCV